MLLDSLIWLLFHTQLLVYTLCAIGALATLAWLWDNFASLVCIVKTVLLPYFLPSEGQTLAEKFGNWAGEFLYCQNGPCCWPRVALHINEW